MIEIKVYKYNKPINMLPDDSTICVDIFNMTNPDTDITIKAKDYLIEDYSQRYSRAFKVEDVNIFASIKKRTDDRFKYIGTEKILEDTWFIYEHINHKDNKIKPLNYNKKTNTMATDEGDVFYMPYNVGKTICESIDKINEIIEYINKENK